MHHSTHATSVPSTIKGKKRRELHRETQGRRGKGRKMRGKQRKTER